MITNKTKSDLLVECAKIMEERYQRIKNNISGLEEALYEESKSSAGDKHETERAMLQIEIENSGKQLMEVENIMQTLKRIESSIKSEFAHLGSLVHTGLGTYFLSVSAGDIELDETHYLCVSLNSPIGKLLVGKKEGEIFEFHENTYKIHKVE